MKRIRCSCGIDWEWELNWNESKGKERNRYVGRLSAYVIASLKPGDGLDLQLSLHSWSTQVDTLSMVFV